MAVSPLAAFSNVPVDWNMTPEVAVILYLEWGNNNWQSEYPPVRSASDTVYYFVVDAWTEPLSVRLVRRSMAGAEDLVSIPLPEALVKVFRAEYGQLKGVFEPLPEIKNWLREELQQT